MATPDTLTTDPVKKPPAALPLAGGTPTASSTLSTPSNPTATAQPALPLAPVTPSGPATTSDPMAFAPNAGGTPAIAGDPGAAAGGYVQAPPMQGVFAGADVLPGFKGWQDGTGHVGTAPATPRDPSSFTSLDDWYASQGTGGPRYSPAANGGGMVDNAIQAYTGQQGMNPALDADFAKAQQAARDALSYGSTHGGFGSSATNPNAETLTQSPWDPVHGNASTTFTNADGKPATQGGTVPPRHLSPGPANDVNGSTPASNPLATVGTPGTPGTPASGLNGLPNVGPTATTANGTVGTTPTDPNNPLTLQTLSVGPTADRFKLAQDQWNQFQKATDPAYQATLREADAHDFGAGRGVSGKHRNSIGDLETQRANALDTQRNTFLDAALGGSIEDAYRNVGIAQQQQGYQSDQQKTGFGQNFQLQQLADAENSQSFQQAYQQALLGYSGDPAQLYMLMARQWATNGGSK